MKDIENKVIQILNKYQSKVEPLHDEGVIDPMDFHKIAKEIASQFTIIDEKFEEAKEEFIEKWVPEPIYCNIDGFKGDLDHLLSIREEEQPALPTEEERKAISFICNESNCDDYVASHIDRFMNGDNEPDDNSCKLEKEWYIEFNKVVEFLSRLNQKETK